MKYAIADTTNGIIEETHSYVYAMTILKEFVNEGIKAELEYQDESGLTIQQIEEKVKSFYHLIEIQ